MATHTALKQRLSAQAYANVQRIMQKKTEPVVSEGTANAVRTWIKWLCQQQDIPPPDAVCVFERDIVSIDWYYTKWRIYFEVGGDTGEVEVSASDGKGTWKEQACPRGITQQERVRATLLAFQKLEFTTN